MMVFPQKFGRYLLVDKIASGGMAEIYKAKLIGVEGFEKTVVIKRIHPFWSERRDFVAMLVDEAKILVHLNHPNIVQVFELGREGETYFIAMEYVEGTDLRQLLAKLKSEKKNLPQAMAIRIMTEALRGLHYAHQRSLKDQGPLGIVHRDISPQNILISFDGEVKVTDFGIAKALTQTHETQTGVLKGKYAYMSPEQATGTSLDARSDLFACGTVLYELLFHERLFASKNDFEVLEKVRNADFVWPVEKMRGLFPGVEGVLRKALAQKSLDRFATAEEFAEALERCLPPSEKITRREMAIFFGGFFADELRNLRIQEKEITNRTKSFLRQTKITPPSAKDTVSLIEMKTVLEESPSTKIETPSTLSARTKPNQVLSEKINGHPHRLRPYLLGVFAILILALFFFGKRVLKGPDPQPSGIHQSAVQENPNPVVLAPAAPALTNIPPRPTPSPSVKKVGELLLKTLPPQVDIEANYLGGKTTLKKKAPSFGGIRINAVPWGLVNMPGFLSGSETPISRNRIPEGTYRLSVNNPALKKTVSATASIHGGKTTRCDADFEGKGTIRCR